MNKAFVEGMKRLTNGTRPNMMGQAQQPCRQVTVEAKALADLRVEKAAAGRALEGRG
jgi:hypothetical protein